jgi:hypothetical protein
MAMIVTYGLAIVPILIIYLIVTSANKNYKAAREKNTDLQ